MKYILILTLLLTSVNCFSVTHLNKGDLAPNSGYLFTEKEERKLRQNDHKRITLEDLNILKDEKILIQEQRIGNLKEQNKDLKFVNKYGKWVYYFAGVLMSSFSIYMGSRFVKEIRE